jgi:urease gamma subunit
MKLAPRELDKLRLHQAGVLAQKRLARGVRLNYPEAVALIATQVSHVCYVSLLVSFLSLSASSCNRNEKRGSI